MTKKILLIFSILIILFFIASSAQAIEFTYPMPQVGKASPAEATNTIELIQYVYLLSLGIVGLVAMLNLIYAGFLWLTAGGNASAIKNATDKIQNTILGIIILLAAVLILNTINPDLTKLKPLQSFGLSAVGGFLGAQCSPTGANNLPASCAAGLKCAPDVGAGGLEFRCQRLNEEASPEAVREQINKKTEGNIVPVEDQIITLPDGRNVRKGCRDAGETPAGSEWRELDESFCSGLKSNQICCGRLPKIQ